MIINKFLDMLREMIGLSVYSFVNRSIYLQNDWIESVAMLEDSSVLINNLLKRVGEPL